MLMIRPDALGLHVRNDGTADAKHPGQVDPKHLLPSVDRKFVDGFSIRRLHPDPGIVDENVDPARRRCRLGDRRVDAGSVRDIHCKGEMTFVAWSRGACSVDRTIDVEVRIDDPRAVSRQRIGYGTADPLRCASHQCDLPLEVDLHGVFLWGVPVSAGLVPQLVITTFVHKIVKELAPR